MGEHARKRGLRAARFGAVSLLATAVLAELLLRWLAPVDWRAPPPPQDESAARELMQRRSSVPGLTYELVPNRKGVHRGVIVRTNSHGMRDAEPEPGSPPDLVRLAALGDSVTFGFGVKASQAWPNALECLLQQGVDTPRYEVLNFGVGGYSTREEAAVLRHEALALHPDLVLVGYSFNDPETEPIQPVHRFHMEAEWWQHSHLLRLVDKARHARDVQRYGGGDYHLYLHNDPARWQSVVDAFADMADSAGAAGVPVVVVINARLLIDDWADYRWRSIHEQVASAAREAGFGVLDLYDTLRRHDPAALRNSDSDGHPNAACHELMAEAIAAFLRERYPDVLANARR